MAQKRKLNRGLEALLGSGLLADSQGQADTAASEGAIQTGAPNEIPVEKLQRGTYQPRREFDAEALQTLADSIKAQGILQPIVARPVVMDTSKSSPVNGVGARHRWRVWTAFRSLLKR